ncbi:MAG: hypothetical protein ACOZQL_20525 [Myxococcota bacterium]
MSGLVQRLLEARWLPKARRDTALRVLNAHADALTKPLLEVALATQQPEAVGAWVDLASRTLTRDPKRRLTQELLEHVIRVSGARVVRPAALRDALEAVLSAPEVDVAKARAALLALGGGVSLADAHGIFVSAARKAKPDALPKEPPHLGGPVPELSVFETVEVALTLARAALAKQPQPDAARLVALAEQELSWARGGRRGPEPTRRADEPAPAKAKGPAFALARAALLEARKTDHVSARGTSLKSAVQAGLVLGEAWWLSQVDEAVMLADARTAWERRSQVTSSPLTHVVWRGGDATSRLWLGRLADGRYALLAKLGRTWSSTEGDLESVAATVPDAWFARAMPVVERRR